MSELVGIDVAKLRYIFSYLAVVSYTSPCPSKAATTLCARQRTSVDNDFQDTYGYAVERYSNKRTRNCGMERTEWP
jgi:hypothetical protein